jgi:hypothetical protein
VSRHYQDARRVLASMAEPVGRQRGRGRGWLWRLKELTNAECWRRAYFVP